MEDQPEVMSGGEDDDQVELDDDQVELDDDQVELDDEESLGLQLQCHLCQQDVQGLRGCIDHMAEAHPDLDDQAGRIYCILCSKAFTGPRELKRHIQRHLEFGLIPVLEDNSGGSMVFESGVGDDNFEWWRDTTFRCQLCSLNVLGFNDSVVHMAEAHPQLTDDGRQAICIVCHKSFGRKDHLKNHVWSHVNKIRPGAARCITDTDKRPVGPAAMKYTCTICNSELNGLRAYCDHVAQEHPERPCFKCPICDKDSTNYRQMRVHCLLHTDYKRCCPHCPKVFVDAYKLNRHVKEIHNQTKDHICHTCGKAFSRLDKLKAHEKSHIKASKPVEWVSMGNEAANATTESSDSETSAAEMKSEVQKKKKLWAPSRTKEGDWSTNLTLTCHACDQKVLGFGASVNHMKDSHSNHIVESKAYMCIFCSKGFLRRDHLKNHVYSHVKLLTQQEKLDSSDFKVKEDHIVLDEMDCNMIDEQMFERKPRPIKEDWSTNLPMDCHVCNLQVFGFGASVSHMKEMHPDHILDSKAYMCIFCSKGFLRRDHLKKHVYSHVKSVIKEESFNYIEPQVEEDTKEYFYDAYGEQQQHFNEQNYMDFVETIPLICRLCFAETIGFTMYSSHIVDVHNIEQPAECPVCEVTAFDDLRQHLMDFHLDMEPKIKSEIFETMEVEVDAYNYGGFNEQTNNDVDDDEDWVPEQGVKGAKEEVEDEDEERLFDCQFCGRVFVGIEASIDHVSIVHPSSNEGTISCISCSEEFFNRETLASHMLTHEPNDTQSKTKKRERLAENKAIMDIIDQQGWCEIQVFNCYICQEDIATFDASVDHMRKVHFPSSLEEEYHCIQCTEKTHLPRLLKIHLWRHFNDPSMLKKFMKNTVKESIQSKRWKCKICDDIKVIGIQTYVEHMGAIHGCAFYCPCCEEKSFESQAQFEAHVETHCSPKFACQRCGKTFVDAHKRRRHYKEVHEKVKGHTCNTCGKSFTRSDKLRTHERIHSDNSRPFLCEQCGKGFTRPEHVKRHAKICGKVIVKSPREKKGNTYTPRETNPEMIVVAQEIAIDSIEPTEEGKFKCPNCESTFRNKRCVVEHYARLHSTTCQQMNHLCPKCGKGFKMRKDLLKHMKRPHTDEYMGLRIPCPEEGCGKRFKKEINLKRHLLFHKGIREFKCDKCDKMFHARQALRAHYKLKHDTVYPLKKKVKRVIKKKPKPPQEIPLPDNPAQPQQHHQHHPSLPLQPQLSPQTHHPTFPGQLMYLPPPPPQPVEQKWPEPVPEPAEPEPDVMPKKKPKPKPLTEMEKSELKANMADGSLGALCPVCFKIFRNREALEFHILNTKMTGHEALFEETMRIKYGDMPPPPPPLPPPLVQHQQPEPHVQPIENPTQQEIESFEPRMEIKVEPKEELLPSSAPTAPPHPPPTDFPFKCAECNKGFDDELRLLKHVSKKHTGPKKLKKTLKLSPMGCPDCEKSFEFMEELIRHFSSHPHAIVDTSDGIVCPVLTCEVRLASDVHLQQHLKEGKHGQKCPQCGRCFGTVERLEIHVRGQCSPPLEKPFTCPSCERPFKDANELGDHMVTHGDNRPHLCSECGIGFVTAEHLKRHTNSSHAKNKSVKCNFCDKFFVNKYKARIHERKHTGEKPYLCNVCAKAFRRKESLDHHTVTHMNIPKNFKCVTCGASFVSQQYLNRHISRHFAEKKHKCKDCSMAFIEMRDLRVHVRHVHQNLRPFSCEHCNSSYKSKQGLTTHHKAHPDGQCADSSRKEGEKQIACPHCDKLFNKKSSFDVHLQSCHPTGRESAMSDSSSVVIVDNNQYNPHPQSFVHYDRPFDQHQEFQPYPTQFPYRN